MNNLHKFLQSIPDALKELRICRNAPGVSHLLFADDTLLFFRASPDQAEVIKEVVVTYGKCTAQQINQAKCSIMFNDNCQQEVQAQVKSILQVEIYIMSVFKLPLGLCDDLTGIIRSFWLAWEQMILKKCCGGMGFKDLRLFSQAMLARLLKAKYFPRGSLVDTAFCSNASIPWQAIMHGLELLNQGIIWRVANGK